MKHSNSRTDRLFWTSLTGSFENMTLYVFISSRLRHEQSDERFSTTMKYTDRSY